MTKSIDLHLHYMYMTLCVHVCISAHVWKRGSHTQKTLCICLNVLKDESVDVCVNYTRSLTVLVITFTSLIDVHTDSAYPVM